MRQAKSAELKKEIVILSQTFERIMDRKSAVIQQLAKDLEESEEQSRMATRSHQQNLGKLMEVSFYFVWRFLLADFRFKPHWLMISSVASNHS